VTTTSVAERAEILRPVGLSPLLTTEQLTALYGVGRTTVNEWRKKGLPIERLPNGDRRFDLSAVQRWMAGHAEAAEAATADRARRAVAARA
jgi:phage terminase Nu1 subunit (DNA packaging protein)